MIALGAFVRIVLDACVPQPLRAEIIGHEVFTSHYLGFDLLRDADLLNATEGNYDVLITCDRGIPWQNQFKGRSIAIVVLRAPSNKLQDLELLIPALLRVLPSLQPGEVCEIDRP